MPEKLMRNSERTGTDRFMESRGKPDHKKTKRTVEKDTEQFWKSIWCIITVEGAIE